MGKLYLKSKSIVSFAVLCSFVFIFTSIATAAPQNVKFGISALRTKIGDGQCFYVGGGHNIVVNGNDVYVAYGDGNFACGEVQVIVGHSADGGLTWERSEIAAHGAYIKGDGSAIAVGPDKTIHLIWGDENPTSGRAIWYSNKMEGAGWSAPQNVSGTMASLAAYSGNIAVDGRGGVHISFRDDSGPMIYYSYSNDGGMSFIETATPVAFSTYEAPIAADNNGNAYLVYEVEAYYSCNINFVKRSAGSSSWSSPVAVNRSSDHCYGTYPSMAVYDANNIYIAFTGYGGLYVSSTSNGGNTSSDWVQNLVTSEYNDLVSIAVDANMRLNLVGKFWDNGNRIKFSRSINGGSIWSSPITVDSEGDWPHLAVDSSGLVYIMENRNGAAYFIKEQ